MKKRKRISDNGTGATLHGGGPMKSVLEELWYGNIRPDVGARETTPPVKRLMGYIADHYDTLRATLTKEQKEILEKFDSCSNELAAINEREIFVYAFRLGAKIMLEIMLSEDNEKNE